LSHLLEKEKGQEQTYEAPEGAILEKLTNDAKSPLVKNFSIQKLDSSVPKDFIDNFKNYKNLENDKFQLKRLHDLGEDQFQEELDIKAFSNLFPYGKDHMWDTSRHLSMRNADYIKRRLFCRHRQFRLDKTIYFTTLSIKTFLTFVTVLHTRLGLLG